MAQNIQKKLSTNDIWVQQYNVVCKQCDRGNIAVYFCNVDGCKDGEVKLYCMECSADDRKHNQHANVKIQAELQKRIKEWQELVEDCKKIKRAIDDNYPLIQPIVKYLENENSLRTNLNVRAPSQNLLMDIDIFNEQFLKINEMLDQLEKYFEEKDLLQIVQKIPDLIVFQKFFEKIKYLEHLKDANQHEEFLYEMYEPTLRIAATSSRPFADFSKENYDTLTRLKWRWVENNISSKIPQGEWQHEEQIQSQSKQSTTPSQHEEQKQHKGKQSTAAFYSQEEIHNLVTLVKQLQVQVAAQNGAIDKSALSSKIESYGKKIAELELYTNSCDAQIKERVSQLEAKVPNLDCRLTKVVQLNLECDFPSSLKTLVSQQLQSQLDQCVQRLNAIENLEISVNETSLRDQMKKLDDLDKYTRTQIKNEIATERVNYVNAQRTAIESGLNDKIQQKASLHEIQNQYQPIFTKIFSVFSVSCSNLYIQSSIVSCSQNIKILSYFPADKRNFLVANIYRGTRDGWSKQVFGQKVFNQGATIIIVKTKLGTICGGFTSNSIGGNDSFTADNTAFVFNMNDIFIPYSHEKAIFLRNNGFEFGNSILAVTGHQLNADNNGSCQVGKDKHYNIEEDSSGKSPLTGEKGTFTCVELEVFKVINY